MRAQRHGGKRPGMVYFNIMVTKVLKIEDPENVSPEMLEPAAEIIRAGGLVAFPTETVYGLGGNAIDPDASRKIYAAKGRPSDNPLIVHIADIDELEAVAAELPDAAVKLICAFWPGPLTLVLKKRMIIPDATTGGLPTVAVRMPSHPVAAMFIRTCGLPVAAPSANLSGRPSPTTARHVLEDLDGRIDMVIDGGSAQVGLESTIVDVSTETASLLRPGEITLEMLRGVVPGIQVDPAVTGPVADGVKPKAPGMKYRHYAPKAEMSIVTGETGRVREKILELAAEQEAAGKRVGILAAEESAGSYGRGTVRSVGTRADEETVAHNLFSVLREFDALDVDVIYAEGFEERGIGRAVMNRLRKAAGYRVIEV